MLIISYPLFQAGKILALRANNFGLSSVLVGREVILCFRQGRLAFRANNFGLSSVLVGREVILCFRQGRLAFRANNFGLSSVPVGREVKCEVLVIWKVNNS